MDVADEVLEQYGITLADFGETFDQQLDAVMRQAQQTLHLGTSHAISLRTVPRKLDFVDGFRGWVFMGTPKQYDYHLDTTVAYQSKFSLALTLREGEHTADETFPLRYAGLMHEGFLARDYRGRRLRLVAYARAEAVEQGAFTLQISGPAYDGEGGGGRCP